MSDILLGVSTEQYESLAPFLQGATAEQQEALKDWARQIGTRDSEADVGRVQRYRAKCAELYKTRMNPAVSAPIAAALCLEADNAKDGYAEDLERLKRAGLIERIAQWDKLALDESRKHDSSRVVTALVLGVEDPAEFAAQEYAETNWYHHTMDTAPFPLNRRTAARGVGCNR